MKLRICWLAAFGLLLLTPDPVVAQDYADVRIEKFPIAVQCWTFRRFTFFETLERTKALGIDYVQAYPGQRVSEETGDLSFDHNLTDDQISMVQQKLRDIGIRVVAYGVVGFGNTEADARKVFDFARKMRIGTIVTEPDTDDYSLLERMVSEYRINLAVHNHPTPNKYAQPETVLERVEGRDPRLGACADTGHWMRSGVVPVEALKLLKGRIIDVHLKDLDRFGERRGALDVPFGSGMANIHDILAELTLQGFEGYLVIEHEHPDEWDNPEPSLIKGLEYIRSITYWEGYEQILRRTGRGYSKAGWNHYGPGYFELDRETGVITARGGMGLFWYSVKEFKDFILEFDYRSSEPDANSGVFLRIPTLPTSNDYIYHSFEIQIQDNGEGIHRTAAVYDAEASRGGVIKPTGEWNHLKITFVGKHIEVELNNEIVVDWEAEPRGKVADFAEKGYIGFQNHDPNTRVDFRNIFVKEIQNIPPDGFVTLFNGNDLTGWKGLVADPPKRAAMGAEELAEAQMEADEDMRAHWREVDGVLTFDGKGHSLCTARDYHDFEMFVDWKIQDGGDSGIYLRGSPQVQIWDTAQWPQGSGGLYNNQKNPSNPLVVADRPTGTWNTFWIRMVGDRVSVRLNGILVVDNVVMENYWQRDKPIYPAGQIELQAHSTPLFFRNIFIREIAR